MHCAVFLLLWAMQALSASGNIPPGPSLSVMVLTSGSWPTQPGAHCQLPKELNAICERFQNHYLGAHTGRRLTWQVNMGFADIKAVFEERKYELNVTTYSVSPQGPQALLLFRGY